MNSGLLTQASRHYLSAFYISRNASVFLHASPALHNLLELNAHELAPGLGLDAGDDAAQPLISHLFQQPQQPCLEEHLQARGRVKGVEASEKGIQDG